MKLRHGKKYREVKKLVEPKSYLLDEAVALLKKTSPAKFDATCEVHVNLAVDPKQADQNVRATVSLPHGTGKKVRVIAFVAEDKKKAALAAGAMKAGSDDLIEEITKGFLDFDVAVATPDMMKSLGKVARTLGQKGLMPNPKAGTVTPNVEATISEIVKGRVEFRTDSFGIVHNVFGKVSFDESALKENFKTFLRALLDAKPAGVKGTFIQGVAVATTMGPGIRLDLQKTLTEIKQEK